MLSNLKTLLNFNKKSSETHDAALRALTIYNTELNSIILVQFGIDEFYDAISFVSIATKAGIKVIVSQYVEVVIPENPKTVSPNIPLKHINHKYYILISGTPNQYCETMKYISLENKIITTIFQEIYKNMSSTSFQSLIDDYMISEDSFTYKRVTPKYDKLATINTPTTKRGIIQYDDISYIKTKLPNVFNMLDVASMIHIYLGEIWGDESYITATDAVKNLFEYRNAETDIDKYNSTVANIKLLSPLYREIIPEFGRSDNIDDLAILIYPVYKREIDDTESDDDNEPYIDTGSIPMSELDVIFQQEYDRFTMPTAEYSDIYKPIDEVMRN